MKETSQYRRALRLARVETASARKEALVLLQEGSRLGDTNCQFALGTWYLYGRCVRKDYRRANDLFARAARAGHADAQFYLAVSYEHGKGRRKNEKLAFRWYNLASKRAKGPDASLEAARCLYWGIGTKADHRGAVRLYLQAARRGSDEAQYDVARAYEKGDGVARSTARALRWYRRAAAAGNKPARAALRDLERR